jgi:chromosome segregation ATPase
MNMLAFVKELERRDADAATRLADVEELQSTVEHLRARAADVLAFEAALPRERAARALTVERAEGALARAQAARAQAEAELERARGKDRAAAEHAVETARADERTAAAELERARNSAAGLEQEAERTAVATGTLEREAGIASDRLAALPRLSHDATVAPQPGVAGVEDWGARARPALLLLRAALAAERDAIVREANEVGSAALGESVGATSVQRVRERLEETRP